MKMARKIVGTFKKEPKYEVEEVKEVPRLTEFLDY
jgi:hypothetical protein